MHAMKVTCVGQTFALANCSDSGGKKSRIRRSKEERKSMVESFIKKYQNSNDGSFPSLNLTHKEVGGSFYTVREIVREVIQENRVLGPAKFTSEELKNVEFSEQYPLGSISTQPPSDLFLSTDGTHFVSDNHHSNDIELVSTLSGQVNGKQQQIFDNGRYNKEIMVDKVADANKSSSHVNDEIPYTDVEISHILEVKLQGVEEIVQAPTSKVTSVATDVIVETFPLEPSAKPTQGSDEMSDEAKVLTRTLEEHEAKKVEVSSTGKTLATDVIVETFPLEPSAKPTQGSDEMSDESKVLTRTLEKHEAKKVEVSSTGKTVPMLVEMNHVELEKKSSDSMDEKSAGNPVDPLAESLSSCTTGKSITTSIVEDRALQDASSNDVSSLQTSHQIQVVLGVEPKHAPNATDSKNKNASSTCDETLSQGAVVKTKVDMQDKLTTEEGKNSTLNRINLNSWEGASKKSERREADPWEIVKAFINALVKFWTE